MSIFFYGEIMTNIPKVRIRFTFEIVIIIHCNHNSRSFSYFRNVLEPDLPDLKCTWYESFSGDLVDPSLPFKSSTFIPGFGFQYYILKGHDSKVFEEF